MSTISQSSNYFATLSTTGTTIDVNSLNSGSTGYTYALYGFFVMGNSNDMINVTVNNNLVMDLPSGFQFNYMPIVNVKVNKIVAVGSDGTYHTFPNGSIMSQNPGICIYGEKTTKTMFGNF